MTAESEKDTPLIPCPECNADLWDGEDTTATIEEEFTFGSRTAERTVPAKICPDCGSTVAL